MAKKWLLPLVLILAVGLVVVWSRSQAPQEIPQPDSSQTSSQTETATVSLDFAETRVSYSAEVAPNQTVLALLQQVAQANNHTVAVKKYDFGTLVESIDDKANSMERSWIYFINGNAADAGADQKTVAPGDLIEWRYLEPAEQ